MDERLSDLRAELARIQKELGALPEDAHQRRWELRARQSDLRNEATALAFGEGRTAEQLQADLSRLVELRDQRLESRSQPSNGGRGRGIRGWRHRRV